MARSTFASQNVPPSGHFLKFSSVKMARCCGAKHICKSKYTKHLSIPQHRAAFGSSAVEKWHAALARSAFASQSAKKHGGSGHFLKFGCRKIIRCCGAKHIYNSKCTKHLRFGPLFEFSISQRCPIEEINRLILVSQVIIQSVNQSISQLVS